MAVKGPGGRVRDTEKPLNGLAGQAGFEPATLGFGVPSATFSATVAVVSSRVHWRPPR
jgi:hypothetical protein